MAGLINSTINNGTNGTASNTIDASTTGSKKVIHGSDGTNVYTGKKNASNALGYVGGDLFSITSFPVKLRRCDQVILLPVERLTDWNDYCKKTKGYFSLSVYMANMFETKDSGKLIESISLDKASIPMIVPGAPNCIQLDGPNMKRIGVCFKTKDETKEIMTAYKDFMRCRLGDNLKGFSPQVLDRLLKLACMGKKLPESVKKDIVSGLLKASSESNDIKNEKVNMTEINPYYKSLLVPGDK